ncbi:MAG TPA: GNAT family N-acetyltransferase [Longimicrobium sp.]|jgi:GNAT superfamily N-acetyltransferase
MIFRCTQRLLKATKLPVTTEPPEPAAPLGEWYVNLVPVPFAGRSLVLYTNPTTLVCVVAPGRALHTTLPTFRRRVPALLRRLDLPGEWIDAQLSDLSETIVARTNNRRVLGSMNDLATQIWFEAERYRSFEGIDLDRLEVKLADNPHAMLGYKDATWVLAELAGVVEPRPFPHRPSPLHAAARLPTLGFDLRVRPALGDAVLNDLFAAAWPDHVARGFATVLSRSLGWVGAYVGERLIGFVNVAWDGGAHAFLLDTTVHPDHQRRGIGTALVRQAVAAAREAGAEWIHVDYEPRLDDFYEGCGFRPSAAGLIRLTRPGA